MNVQMKRIFPVLAAVLPTAFLAVFLAALLGAPKQASAQNLSFIRDAEIENTIREYATPLFRAAGLEPSAIKIYLVRDQTLNAFVAGGQRIFLNTGLLTRSTNASQVIGVIAHETGHISGGHLSRMQDAMKKSSAQAIITTLLGGAAIIAGQGKAGSALIIGGQSSATGAFLHYTRTQEGAADQAALRFLDTTKQSARGMREFFEILSGQEFLTAARQDPYLRTHPLTQERIDAVDNHLANSPFAGMPEPERWEILHRRMKAKLQAFLEPLGRTLIRYPETNTRMEARYARTIGYYRAAKLDKAVPLIDQLIAEHPSDPYFWELKGQMLFENGRAKEALHPYEMAVRFLPTSPLLRSGLAQVQIELNDPALYDDAIRNLNAAISRDSQIPFVWRQLAIVHGRKGAMGKSALAMAEEAMLREKKDAARYHAGKAEKILPRGSIGWFKAQDILQSAGKEKKEK